MNRELRQIREARLRHRADIAYRQFMDGVPMAKIGESLGVTSERTRQILVEGTKRGWIKYQSNIGWIGSEITKKRIVYEAKNSASAQELADRLCVSISFAFTMMKKLGIGYEPMYEMRKNRRKTGHLKEYANLVRRMGFHPPAMNVPTAKKNGWDWFLLAANLRRYYGELKVARRLANIELGKDYKLMRYGKLVEVT